MYENKTKIKEPWKKRNSQRSSSMEVKKDDKDDVMFLFFLPYSRIYAFINCSVINDVATFFYGTFPRK